VNPHQTWFQLLPGWPRLEEFAARYLERKSNPFLLVFTATHFTLTHVLGAVLVVLVLTVAAFRYRRAVSGGGDERIVPPRGLSVRNLLEMFTEAVIRMMAGVMGEHHARRFLPLVGSLAFFIFLSNLLGLIPGFVPPTATLKTNVALAGCVFLMTHAYGVRAHGLAYFKHFLGPVWYLAWLMLPIELISHIARPLSLSIRLLGNIFADHKVVAAFFVMVPLLVPLPFMLLGVVVAIVQTLVFSLLTTVYISMAVAEEEH
jgi:F-type H+-transporting ATPase subunit a